MGIEIRLGMGMGAKFISAPTPPGSPFERWLFLEREIAFFWLYSANVCGGAMPFYSFALCPFALLFPFLTFSMQLLPVLMNSTMPFLPPHDFLACFHGTSLNLRSLGMREQRPLLSPLPSPLHGHLPR